MISPYAQVGPRLVERGYSGIPIMPDSKSPGELRRGEWRPMSDWGRFALRLPRRFEIQVWNTLPAAGVGLVVGPASGHVIGLDLDTDDAAITTAIMSAVPTSTVSKRGAKGKTIFYRAPTITKSKSWNLTTPEGKTYRVCDLIGPGRQTLLPPTIHPDTKLPYVWLGPDTLENTGPDELPELTQEHIAAMDEALKPLGYVEEIIVPERGPSAFVCDDKRGREYALGALRGCADELANAVPGSRNGLLNALSFRLGRMAARGWLSEDEIGAELWSACLHNGLIADDGPHAFRATFWSGLRAGEQRPAPDPRERNSTIDPQFVAALKPPAA